MRSIAEIKGLSGLIDAWHHARSELIKAAAICGGSLYYNGHNGNKMNEEDVVAVKRIIMDDRREKCYRALSRLADADIDISAERTEVENIK